jgi:hypothetical protein
MCEANKLFKQCILMAEAPHWPNIEKFQTDSIQKLWKWIQKMCPPYPVTVQNIQEHQFIFTWAQWPELLDGRWLRAVKGCESRISDILVTVPFPFQWLASLSFLPFILHFSLATSFPSFYFRLKIVFGRRKKIVLQVHTTIFQFIT